MIPAWVCFASASTDGKLAGGICQQRTRTAMGDLKYVHVCVFTNVLCVRMHVYVTLIVTGIVHR